MWIKSNNQLTFSAARIEALENIPNGVWLLKLSPDIGFYLEVTPAFGLPKKIYGDSEKIARRYLNTFAHQNTNLGVLLTGLKGTGKSVTAKVTCHLADRPVILITEPFIGDGFKSFLSNISQEVIVFIDEFEKVYYEVQWQTAFLSILDGIFTGKKMFLFTSNEKGKINEYMLNRPGRVHYLKEYDTLDQSIINDVISDNLVNQGNRVGLIEVLSILSNVTMDMLMSLIKEMNLYSETARESVRFLNLRPERQSFDLTVFNNNGLKIGTSTINHHPLAQEKYQVSVYCNDMQRYTGGSSNHNAVLLEINEYRKRIGAAPIPLEAFETEDSAGSVPATYSLDLIAATPSISATISEDAKDSGSDVAVKKARKRAVKISPDKGVPEAPRGHIYYNIEVKKLKMMSDGTDVGNISTVDAAGNRFVFEKTKSYSYMF